MVYPNPSSIEYECLPLGIRPISTSSLEREFAWMERLFEEWFMTLDELKIACAAAEVRRIRKLTDRSDYLASEIGGFQPAAFKDHLKSVGPHARPAGPGTVVKSR